MMGSLTVFSDVSQSETKASESMTVVMMMMQLCGGFMHRC